MATRTNDDDNNDERNTTQQQLSTSSSLALPPPGQVVITNPYLQPTLPTLKYGYRTKPMTWTELEEILIGHGDSKDLARLTRSKHQQRTYQIFQYHMKQQYVSSTDYLLISKFGFDAVAVEEEDDEDQKSIDQKHTYKKDDENNAAVGAITRRKTRWKASPSLSESSTSQTLLVANDFPYFVEDDIKHYVFWKLNGGNVSNDELEIAIQQLRIDLNAVAVLHWTNPPNLQSLPDIDHVHILCRLPSSPSPGS
jgi:Protein of unknown function (DUF3605)